MSNLTIEKQIIGSIILEPENIPEVITILKACDFTYGIHREIYNKILSLYESGGEINPFTVAHNKDDSSYEVSLVEDCTSPAMCISLAKTLKKESVKRESKEQIAHFLKHIDTEEDISNAISELETSLFKANSSLYGKDLTTIHDSVKKVVNNINDKRFNKSLVYGVQSGFQDLDYLTCGFQKSDLIILAGRPSMGKTAMALDIMINADVPVAMFSLEMPEEQLINRILCGRTNINSHNVRTGNISEDEFNKIYKYASTLSSKHVYIDDTSGISVEEIVAKAKKIKTKHDIKLVIIDYIQLVTTASKHQSREQEVSYISRKLKGLARDLNVPVIALSQLNRNLEQRNDKRPNLSDLRESGSLEQDADIVLFMYRHEVYEPDDKDSKGKAELIIGKHRNGGLGTIPLCFKKEISSFKSFSSEKEYDAA
jgi:replicative DNA helicase